MKIGREREREKERKITRKGKNNTIEQSRQGKHVQQKVSEATQKFGRNQ